MRPLFWHALGVLVIFVVALVAWHQVSTAFLNEGATQVQVQDATAAVAERDTVYVHDTIVRSGAIKAYRANIQPILLGDPTPREVKIITLADTVIQADSTALAACDSLVAAKDSLLHLVTRKQPQPFIHGFADGLYAPTDKTVVFRAGLTTRPFLPGHLGLQVVGVTPTAPGTGSRLYVGFHTSF